MRFILLILALAGSVALARDVLIVTKEGPAVDVYTGETNSVVRWVFRSEEPKNNLPVQSTVELPADATSTTVSNAVIAEAHRVAAQARIPHDTFEARLP